MGAAMVDEPALVLFAGGIGMKGTVVDSNVDAFAVPVTTAGERGAGVQQPDAAGSSRIGQQGGQGKGEGDVVVEKDVLS